MHVNAETCPSHCCRRVQPLCDLVTVIENRTHIEFARPSDATEIGVMSKNEIEYGLGWKYIPEKIVMLIGDRSRNVVVARVGSSLAGFGIMTYYEDQANLDLLAVKQSFRRMRIGTQVVRWLEKAALTAGAFNIFVQVRSRNSGAIEFYESLGFLVLDEQRGYYKSIEAGLIMAKTLRRMFNAT
jgi:ribosomal protein S18 acetylase RimI-like enzyme